MKTTRRTTALTTLTAALATAAVIVGLALASGGNATAASITRQAAVAAQPAAAPQPAVAPAEPKVRPAKKEQAISPQMLLTDSDAMHQARIGAWQDCLVAHGATYAADRAGPATLGIAPRPVADPVPPAAKAACRSVLPRLPVETNPRLNPDYVADSEANVACLRDHGVPVHLYHDTSVWPDGLSWTYDASDSVLPDNQTQIEKACELEAFSD